MKLRLICEKCNKDFPKNCYCHAESKNAQKRRRYANEYSKRNPIKMLARKKVYREKRAGRLKEAPCRCGSLKVEAHHPDHNFPLEIIWLCKRHHIEIHKSPTLPPVDNLWKKSE